MEERLQKLLSSAGLLSRRRAEEYIAAGRVTVNGEIAQLGQRADLDRDKVCVDGVPVARQEKRVYLMLNKPRGYVTTLEDERGRRTAAQLVADCGIRVYPVGRLDLNSEGLLLFTNDGELANRILHPSHKVEKEYHVRVKGDVAQGLPVLRGPLELDGRPLAPAQVKVLSRQEGGGLLSVTIYEGRNRQVRRMCALAGLEVQRLRRIREGEVRLGNLKSGQWRYLTEGELEHLRGL